MRIRGLSFLAVLVLFSCAQVWAQTDAVCDPGAAVTTKGQTTTIGPATFSQSTCKFRFGFHALQLETGASPGNSCTVTVTASIVQKSSLQSRLVDANGDAIPAVPVGYDEVGKQKAVLYTVVPGGCPAKSDGKYGITVFANFTATNPWIAECEHGASFCSLDISSISPFGNNDPVGGDFGSPPADYFLVDKALGTVDPAFQGTTDKATFCGWFPPLPPELPANLGSAPTLSGGTITYRFGLVPEGSSCPPNANNTVAGAVVFLSVARHDPLTLNFEEFIDVQSAGTANPIDPAAFEIGADGLYKYRQDTSNMAPGLYIACAIFRTSNTDPQCTAFSFQ